MDFNYKIRGKRKRKNLGKKKCTSVYDYNITKLSQITTLGNQRNTGCPAMLREHNLKNFISIQLGQCGQQPLRKLPAKVVLRLVCVTNTIHLRGRCIIKDKGFCSLSFIWGNHVVSSFMESQSPKNSNINQKAESLDPAISQLLLPVGILNQNYTAKQVLDS